MNRRSIQMTRKEPTEQLERQAPRYPARQRYGDARREARIGQARPYEWSRDRNKRYRSYRSRSGREMDESTCNRFAPANSILLEEETCTRDLIYDWTRRGGHCGSGWGWGRSWPDWTNTSTC